MALMKNEEDLFHEQLGQLKQETWTMKSFEKMNYVFIGIVSFYLDAVDIPRKHVLLKIHGSPGHKKNMVICAQLKYLTSYIICCHIRDLNFRILYILAYFLKLMYCVSSIRRYQKRIKLNAS